MAAGYLSTLGGDGVRVYSAGSQPGDAINPAAVEAMDEVGIDIRMQFPKPWSDEVLQAVGVVVTMGCGDECPYYPGTRYVNWNLDDPAGQTMDFVRPIRDDIEKRVRGLLVELDVVPTC
jgi:protein-tyrosine-phosphatase